METRYFVDSETKRGVLIDILMTACIVAVIDGLMAVMITLALYERSAGFVFQYIASGIQGTAAFNGGTDTLLLGMTFHFFISLVWSTVFYMLYRPMSVVLRNIYVRSIIYGIIIWLVMNLVVLPLSRVPEGSFSLRGILIGVIALILAAGLPIAYRSERFFRKVN